MPDEIEPFNQLPALRVLEFYGGYGDVIATFTSEVGGGEGVNRGIRAALITLLHIDKGIDNTGGLVGAEAGLFACPVGALTRNRLLREFIAQF